MIGCEQYGGDDLAVYKKRRMKPQLHMYVYLTDEKQKREIFLREQR